MANLWSLMRRRASSRNLQGYIDLINQAAANYALTGRQTTLGATQEDIPGTFEGYTASLLKANPVVWGCMLIRMSVFSEARFKYRRLIDGRPGELFGTRDLAILEEPWPNGSTGDLLTRMIQDVDLGGNFYGARLSRKRIARLRPDWVTIILGSKSDPEAGFGKADVEVLGYSYKPGGPGSAYPAEPFLVEHVAHWAPYPDPIAAFRGMSWLTPAIREIMGDQAATTHKLNYLEQGAVPNMVVTVDASVEREEFEKWVELFEEEHGGLENAYKCLHPETEVALWNGARSTARDIRAGDTVVAWKDGRPVPGVVSAAELQPPSPIVTVTTERGRVIKTNDAHPFLTSRGWEAAENLNPGDLLQTGLGWGRPRSQNAISEREAWLAGLLVGDGCTAGTPTPGVTIAEAGVLSRATSVATLSQVRLHGRSLPNEYRVKGVTGLVRALGLNGKRSYEKRVPQVVMTGGAEVVGSFLSGYIDADGHVADPNKRESGEVGITSTSLELLRDVQHLLASLGVNASISSPPSMASHPHAAHRLCVFGNVQAARLAEILNLSHTEKARRLSTYAKRTCPQDRSRWDRVKSVVISKPETTIGIEVSDHHTHVTGGVVTHNTIFLGAGSNVEVVGNDLRKVDFKNVQALGENRIAVAAGTPGILVGLSEGLEAATLANYAQAKRRFTDGTMRFLWRGAATSLAKLVPRKGGAELWYDARDIAFLQEDAKDEAEIQKAQAVTLELLVKAGYTPDSAMKAVIANDMARLVHSGLVSVQLQKPGAGEKEGSSQEPKPPEPPPPGDDD